MRFYMKQILTVSVILLMCSAGALAQNASILKIYVGDDQGSATYEMVFGNHVNATWGMGGQKDSLDPTYIEKESPPLPPGLGVVWRPSRSGVSWGIGFLKYDIKGWTSESQVDTFRLYFLNQSATDADIIISWDPAVYASHATAMSMKIGSSGPVIDMLTNNSYTIVDAGDEGINRVDIYKTGAVLIETIGALAVKQEKTVIPDEFRLYHNYPNPFNPTTTIKFDVLKTSNIDVSVYNILGQKVATLVSEELAPGTYSTTWDAMNSSNVTISSGVYYVRMIARDRGVEQFSALHKLLFVK